MTTRRWDDLKKKQDTGIIIIPLEPQILAIADAYDNMVTGTHTEKLSKQEKIKILWRQ